MEAQNTIQTSHIQEKDNQIDAHIRGDTSAAAPILNSSPNLDSGSDNVQETDKEALSSLLMLSKANTEQSNKIQEEFFGEASQGKKLPLVVPKKNVLVIAEKPARNEASQPLSKSIKLDDLRKYFHLPIVEVARQLGTCTTALKKICRKNNISKWPYRQIRSITKSIQSLEMASLNDTLSEDLRIQYRTQIVTLQNAIEVILKDPNSEVALVNMGLSEEALQNLRESNAAAGLDLSGLFGGKGDGGGGSDDDDVVEGTNPRGMDAHQHAPIGTVGEGINHSNNHTNNSTNTPGSASKMANGGAVGVLNLLQWPKPSEDVQNILMAASQMNSEERLRAANGSAKKAMTMKNLKRKAEDGPEEESTVLLALGGGSKPSGGLSLGLSSGMGLSASLGLPTGSSFAASSSGAPLFRRPTSGMGGGILHSLSRADEDEDGGEGNGGAISEVAPPTITKKIEIGDTQVECTFHTESQKLVFSGPVTLATLQRKKLRPNITRKVVPLMEPDIGSNFGIEFIPQFILNIMHQTVSSAGASEGPGASTVPAAGASAASDSASLNQDGPTTTQQPQSQPLQSSSHLPAVEPVRYQPPSSMTSYPHSLSSSHLPSQAALQSTRDQQMDSQSRTQQHQSQHAPLSHSFASSSAGGILHSLAGAGGTSDQYSQQGYGPNQGLSINSNTSYASFASHQSQGATSVQSESNSSSGQYGQQHGYPSLLNSTSGGTHQHSNSGNTQHQNINNLALDTSTSAVEIDEDDEDVAAHGGLTDLMLSAAEDSMFYFDGSNAGGFSALDFSSNLLYQLNPQGGMDSGTGPAGATGSEHNHLNSSLNHDSDPPFNIYNLQR